MRTLTHIKTEAVIIAFLFLIISGCASSESSRFYTLDIVKNTGSARPASIYKLTVTIGPVEIPDYLDRPQIVSRTSQNEISFSEFDRWAGPLQDDITRSLSENLTLLLAENSVFVSRWGLSAASDYRIAVNIRRFDIMPEGNVLLNAQWTVIGKDGMKKLLMREAVITEPYTVQTYHAKVSAMSSALEKLSRDIADGINAVSQKK